MGRDWRKGASPPPRGTDLPTPILSGRRRPAAATGDDVRAARRVLRQAELGGSGDLAAPPLAPAARPTSREREVLALVAAGQTDKQIAAALSISPRTVSNHVASLLRKLGAETRAGAARRARRDGLIGPRWPGNGSRRPSRPAFGSEIRSTDSGDERLSAVMFG